MPVGAHTYDNPSPQAIKHMIHDDAYCDGVQAQRPVFFVFLGKVKSLRNLAPPHKNRTGKKCRSTSSSYRNTAAGASPILKACEP